MAERELINATSDHIPYVPDTMQPRLGEYLLRRNFLTEDQLNHALDVQAQRAAEGNPQRLGETLVDLGYLTRAQLDQAVMEQVVELQAALQQANEQLTERVAERTRQLQDALDKLTELNQQKANFISNISHELRTPLAHVRGYVALLADGTLGEVNDEQRRALIVCDTSISRLGQLIEDLIRFAESSKGLKEANLQPTDLRPTLVRVATTARDRAQRSNLKFELRLPETLPLVRADAEQIGWLVYQLLDNAIKFNRPNGRVLLGVQVNPTAVRIGVMDTGIGIDTDRLSELFVPFHQLDGSSTRRYGGTGLGLALARRIAEMHNTEIQVQSEKEKGSVFSIELPRI